MKPLFRYLLFGCYISHYVYCNRVFEKMYDKILTDMACFKRLNGTHEIGCTSNFWGNVGVIHIIEDIANLTWVIEKGPHPPYVLAVVPELFTVEIIKMASDSGKLSGMVLLGSSNFSKPSHFTGDQTCPNRHSSLYSNNTLDSYCDRKPWNPYGSSLLFMNWNFPIFYLTEEESIDRIVACFDNFNRPSESGKPRDWPLCAIELHSNMYASISSEVCLRRSNVVLSLLINLCEPLEDINIWTSSQPFNKSHPVSEKSIIIISASADAASMFDNISPGANAAITGLVTLLVTCEALFQYKADFQDSDKNVLFTVFEGETWDYIGSSRMVYDMNNNKFPYESIEGQEDQMSKINLTHIDSVIDIKQTGFISKKNGLKSLFLHTDPISNKDDSVSFGTNSLIDTIINESQNWGIDIKRTSLENPLPPSSFQSFLKKSNISGVILTDHEFKFENQYYMSIYDDFINVNYYSSLNGTLDNDTLHKDITEAASILASSLYTSLTGEKKHIEADANITNQLLYCFMKNMNCTYFQEIVNVNLTSYLTPTPAKTFVSVKRAQNKLPVLVLRLLSLYTGSEVEGNETTCTSNNTQIASLIYFPYINNGTCMQSYVHHSNALSPAFIIKDYDWKSSEYSTWTESVWLKSDARIFLRPSPSEEIGLVIGGLVSVLLSVITVYFLSSNANVIFDFEVQPTPC